MRRFIRSVPVILLAASLAALFGARRGESVPLYAARTGLLCQNCHFDPNGGGPRNDFGFAFAKNRHRIEPEDSTSAWKDLTLTNRVGDNFPLYFGVNQRFMAIANTTVKSDSLDRAGFYSMENSLHMAFQPHAKLTLVYSRDGFDAGSSTKEAFGMIGGLPLDGYLKAGRFRTPFGLRLDDHTVATRNGFLDFFKPSAPFSYADSLNTSFLPYDPRQPDMGVELGGEWKGFFGRFAYTDGASEPVLNPTAVYAGAKTLKLGYNTGHLQSGLSFYDDFRRGATAGPDQLQRATRWGYYGLAHQGAFAALGEIAAGTDERVPATGFASGAKENLLAWWAELDYAPWRQGNVRVRYDQMSLDRGAADPYIRDLNDHSRMSLEAEWVPVPFAEVRFALRRIMHKADEFRDAFGSVVPIDDETQSFVQFHFSY
jgi:hypothetical protein